MNTTFPAFSAQSTEELIRGMQILQMDRYSRFSSSFICFYDYIITFDQEASCLIVDVNYKTNIIMADLDVLSAENSIHAIAIHEEHFCDISFPRYAYGFWIPKLAFECFLCSLAIIRGLQHFKLYGLHYSTGARLIDIMIRDSILYFITIGITYLVCMVIWIVDLDKLDVPVGFSVAISSTLCNRMIFKIHRIYANDVDVTNSGKLSVSDS
ncbi:hypothetical protein CVT25_013014 [Psilocybe cyanescens]|uniref:Uncharacterized protein n=1 Tax=Psilocybe cyanescens TaxID=93625 RepID=A0A409XLT8_PSICY|nr:hypothetical protein CVT25_013014 [Psilocybe cyanescens]